MQTPCDGNSHARLDALLVHAPQPRVAVEPLGMLGRVLAGQLVAETGLVARAREVVVERAGPRAQVHVAGAGDDRVEPPTVEHVARLAVDVDESDTAFGELRVAVARERVARLPVVVVGVEDGRDLVACGRHGPTPQSRSVPQEAARSRVGALAVEKGRDTVDDDALVPGGLLDQPHLTRGVVPQTLLGTAVEPFVVVHDHVGGRAFGAGNPGPSARPPAPGSTESRQWASSSDMISCSRTQ